MAEAVSVPRLSDELENFADELEREGLGHFEWTPEGVAFLACSFARTFRFFAIDARLLEAQLDAADAVVAAMKTTQDLRLRIDALTAGIADGKVTILKPARREIDAPSNNGDAA